MVAVARVLLDPVQQRVAAADASELVVHREARHLRHTFKLQHTIAHQLVQALSAVLNTERRCLHWIRWMASQ